MDDLKISHVDSKAVDDLIDRLDVTFGKEAPLAKSRGKVHNYLGPGILRVTMVDYIQMFLAGVPSDLMERSVRPLQPTTCSW